MATALRSFVRPTQGVLPFGFAPEPLEREYTVVSMFSGCGGMDLGFSGGFKVFGRSYERLPFRVVWANELNPAACRTYRRNLGTEIICDDIWKVIDTMPSRADVIIGGFPCQDVSVNGKRIGINGKRTGLYRAMLEGIRRTRPKIFVAENVKGLLMKHHHRAIRQVVQDAISYTRSADGHRTALA
jgi:DNA (cytosine-5)-methyltransferase 1